MEVDSQQQSELDTEIQRYISELTIKPSQTSDQLIVVCHQLIRHLCSLADSIGCTFSIDQCKYLLYGSAAVKTILAMLKIRNVNVAEGLVLLNGIQTRCDISSLINNPIHWSCITVLTAPTGERFSAEVLRFHISMLEKDDTTSVKLLLEQLLVKLAKNTIYKSMIKHNPELNNRTDTLMILARIQAHPEQPSAINNLIWFRSRNFTIEHLLNILLLDRNDYGYAMSCAIYNAFIKVMTLQSNEYHKLFWLKLQIIFDRRNLIEMLWKCIRLTLFYEVLTNQIMSYLAVMERHENDEDDDDYDYMAGEPFVGIPFRIIACYSCILMDKKSPVRKKFSQIISENVLDERVTADLFRYCVYDMT